MSLVAEALASQIAAAEPWPENASLYQQLKGEQILLSDNASSLAVQMLFLHCHRSCYWPVELAYHLHWEPPWKYWLACLATTALLLFPFFSLEASAAPQGTFPVVLLLWETGLCWGFCLSSCI
uniref:Metaxin 2 n=1 Tax=Ornithorhynchus anatinus TaxID=9258 RepID=A0A6I8NXR5_ORNAN